MKEIKIEELKQSENNPRKISARQKSLLKEKMKSLGDLSGVVHDLNSDRIISGNQRTGILKSSSKAKIILTEELGEPTPTGTVGIGYITFEGERFSYRQVRWTKDQCDEAIIVANRVGGEFDYEMIKSEFDATKLMSYGFEETELNRILAGSMSDDPEEKEPTFDDEDINYQSQYGVIIICKDAESQEKVYNQMVKEGYDCRIVVT